MFVWYEILMMLWNGKRLKALYIPAHGNALGKHGKIYLRPVRAIYTHLHIGKVVAFLLFVFTIVVACECPAVKPTANGDFTTDILVNATPVKDEGRGGLSWVYAMLATIESERIILGDSVNLSPEYIVRALLTDEAVKCYLSSGSHAISTRGMPSMVGSLMDVYGAMPYDSYHGRDVVNYDVLCRRLTNVANLSNSLATLNARVGTVIDQAVGYLPKNIYMYGVRYTPKEFAHSVYHDGDYVALTSFAHHPFNQRFALELPDNNALTRFLNLPLESLMGHIEAALRSGHPVCWEGDMSEQGFSFANGTARYERKRFLGMRHGVVTQQERQREFETHRTTDDHCMELIGLAHDKRGVKYVIAKPSWGTGNPYQGLMYLSEDYVRMKTIAVYMTQTAFAQLAVFGRECKPYVPTK